MCCRFLRMWSLALAASNGGTFTVAVPHPCASRLTLVKEEKVSYGRDRGIWSACNDREQRVVKDVE